MNTTQSRITGRRGTHPILRILSAFPIACFTCALCTDIAYSQTANMMWADFSNWLLAAGMAGGVLAAIAGLVIWWVGYRSQSTRRTWIVAFACGMTLVIALFNNFVHSRDAWTSVVPVGLELSALTVFVMLVTAWLASRTNLALTAAKSGVSQ